MATLIELTTLRLRLRQWRTQDFAAFAKMNADPQVMEYYPASLTQTESDILAQRCQSLITERGWGLWAVETQTTPFIGYVGLHIPVPELPCFPCVEIGWRLAHAHWGQGYATEAAQGVLNIAFERLQLPEIVSFTSVHNQRSQAVMARIGMTQVPETFAHPLVPHDHWLNEHCLYKIQNPRFSPQT